MSPPTILKDITECREERCEKKLFLFPMGQHMRATKTADGLR